MFRKFDYTVKIALSFFFPVTDVEDGAGIPMQLGSTMGIPGSPQMDSLTSISVVYQPSNMSNVQGF